MTPAPKLVDIEIDNAKTGCGHRRMVVLRIGRKWVELFYPPMLAMVTISIAQFEHTSTTIEKPRLSKVAAIIRKNVKDAKRLGINDGGKHAKRALQVLKGSA